VVHIVLGAGVAPVGAAFFFFFLFFFGGPLALTWTAAHATGAALAALFCAAPILSRVALMVDVDPGATRPHAIGSGGHAGFPFPASTVTAMLPGMLSTTS
jgi:hypothetical protein